MKSDENNTDSDNSKESSDIYKSASVNINVSPSPKPIKILLIEDNPGDARLVVEYLKTDETFLYELHVVSSLKDINTDLKPDIILLDLNLPGSIGIETFDLVYSIYPEIPIIVQTGLNDSQVGYETVCKGAQDYLVKGTFSGSLLIKTLLYGIERNKLIQNLRYEKSKGERERIISEIFRNASVAIYRTTIDGEFLVVNPAMGKMFGYTAEEFKTLNAKELYPEAKDRLNFRKLLEEKKVITGFEEVLIKKDKTILYTLESSKLVTDENGNIFFEGVIEDITKRKEAEEALTESLKEKDVLLRELYHRTKNNMQVISSLLALKADLINDESAKNILNEMGARIRAIALIHQKLYQSKNLSRIDLKEYIKDLAKLLTDSYKTTSGKISLVLELESVNVLIDTAIPCGLIINELITNSLKYAFPGDREGKISIKLHQSKDGVIALEIADNGIGIPEDKDLLNSGSLGIQLIKSIAEYQLFGDIDFQTKNGVSCIINLKDILYEERI